MLLEFFSDDNEWTSLLFEAVVPFDDIGLYLSGGNSKWTLEVHGSLSSAITVRNASRSQCWSTWFGHH